MGIPRGTTPTLELILEGVDLRDAAHVYVSFRYIGGTMTKTVDPEEITVEQDKDNNDVSTIPVFLNQEETLAFQEGDVSVQVNWTYADSIRASSEVATVNFTKQLLDKAVE